MGDLTEPRSLEGFLAGADLLLHVASAHDHLSDELLQKVNVQGTEALLAEAKRHAPPHFRIWVVSSAVIGAPVYSYYRDTKRIQEKLIRGSGLEWASFRPTLVYGIGDYRHTAPLLRRCAAPRGTLWVPHSGKSKINPVHVEDVVDAVLRFFEFERGVDCTYELAGPAQLLAGQRPPVVGDREVVDDPHPQRVGEPEVAVARPGGREAKGADPNATRR